MWEYEDATEIDQEILITVGSDIEGDRIVALLDSNGIPAYHKHEGIGGYLKVMMGSTPIGHVDVYVLSRHLAPAVRVLESVGILGESEPLSDEWEEEDGMEGSDLEESAADCPLSPRAIKWRFRLVLLALTIVVYILIFVFDYH